MVEERLHYRNFISPLSYHEYVLNADTKMPTDEDHQIAVIEDPDIQPKLQRIEYLRTL